MAEKSAARELRTGQRISEKFDFYLLALTFTLLGFATQSASFGWSTIADACELGGWLFLLVSGVIGLFRISAQPRISKLLALRASKVETLRTVSEEMVNKGTEEFYDGSENRLVPATDYVRTLRERTLPEISAQIGPLQVRALRRFKAQIVLFLLGLTALVLARGLPHALNLLGHRLP